MITFSLYVSFLMFYGFYCTGAEHLDTDNCTIDEKGPNRLKVCVERSVIGVRGGSVTIPCSFTYHTTTTWRIKDLTFVIFKHYYKNGKLISGYQDDRGIDKMKMFQGRVERMEKPEQGLWSVKINNLRVEDEGTYVCRFIYNESDDGRTWRRSGFEARMGKRTELRVDVHPKILNISKEFMNSSNSWRMVCEAEAKPKPNITWLNPKRLPIDGTKITSSTKRQKEFPYSISVYHIISVFNITQENPEGKYTCLVENKYNKAQDHVIHLTTTGNGSSQWIVVGCSIALILVLLLLFAVGLRIYRKKRNHSEGSQAVDGATSNQGPNNEEDQLTYATLGIKMNETPPSAAPEQSENNSIYAVVKK